MSVVNVLEAIGVTSKSVVLISPFFKRRSGVFTSNYPVLGIDARTNKYFTFFHVGGGNLTDEEYNPKIYCYSCVRMPKELCEDDGQWWLQMSYYTNKPTSVFTTKWE